MNNSQIYGEQGGGGVACKADLRKSLVSPDSDGGRWKCPPSVNHKPRVSNSPYICIGHTKACVLHT